jgi:hypothetical protein
MTLANLSEWDIVAYKKKRVRTHKSCPLNAEIASEGKIFLYYIRIE